MLSSATGNFSTATGHSSEASGTESTATGSASVASGNSSTGTGARSQASGLESTATGVLSIASGENSTAIGTLSVANGSNSSAFGRGASASNDNSVALGSNSSTQLSPAAAAAINGGFTVGATTHTEAFTATGEVSVGSAGDERVVTNVADGRVNAASSDAVNGAQLFTVAENVGENSATIAVNTDNIQINASNIQVNTSNIARNSAGIQQNRESINALSSNLDSLSTDFRNFQTETRRGIASSAAIASIPDTPRENTSMLGFGLGSFGGEQAIAIGYSKWLTPKYRGRSFDVLIKGASSTAGSSGSTIASMGIGFSW